MNKAQIENKILSGEELCKDEVKYIYEHADEIATDGEAVIEIGERYFMVNCYTATYDGSDVYYSQQAKEVIKKPSVEIVNNYELKEEDNSFHIDHADENTPKMMRETIKSMVEEVKKLNDVIYIATKRLEEINRFTGLNDMYIYCLKNNIKKAKEKNK